MGAFGKSEPNWCEPNQITYRQGLPKVCVHQFDSQDEDKFKIFWAILVQFRLMRSKSSNLEAWKIWGVDIEMGPYL